MRILFAYRDDVDVRGGAAAVMEHTAAAIRALGHEVDISYEVRPDAGGYDVAHAWNIWSPDSALAQLRHLRETGVPLVWQPFYLDWTEWTWADRAVRAAFDPARGAGERARLLEAMRDGTLTIGPYGRHLPNEALPGFHAALREMLDLVDHVCACSAHEMQTLMQITRVTAKPWTLTRHGVDAAAYRDATPDAFAERFGLRDFVLCVGAVDPRKNQVMLAEALRGAGRPLVVLGPAFDPGYLGLCRAAMGDDAVWIDRVPRELVASAYQAAAVHAMPSFAEGSSLASMEAAAGGCPVVVSNRSSEFEYYGDLAAYCDPVDPATIREAVERAAARRADPAHAEALRGHMARYTWAGAAEATLAAYARVRAEQAPSRRAALGLEGARGRIVLAFAEEVVERPDLLRGYAAAVTDADDVTLVVDQPPEAEHLEARLVAAAAAAGIDGPESADVIATALPRPLPPGLRTVVDAVLTHRELPARLHDVPRVAGPDAARIAAGRTAR